MKMTYERRKKSVGYLFISIWSTGFLAFFLRPLIQSVRYSFSDINMQESGGYLLSNVGLKHYIQAFTGDAEFLPLMLKAITDMLYQVPIITLFSLFIAMVLNQKFRGRVWFRAAFFLPVIIANGIILSILNGDVLSQTIMARSSSSQLFKSDFLYTLMFESGVSQQIINLTTGIIDSLFGLIWKSGIQIIVFLAGLQAISESMYEAAKMEGATGWEVFWKITFPLISPMIILNLIFTIIDSFTDYSNEAIRYINTHQTGMRLAYSSALGWIYFLMVFIVIVIVYLVINRKVFYQV